MRKLTTILLALILLTGCMDINTTDPIETYKYWAGDKPPDSLKVLKGQYWQSTHWSREYIMYLKLKPTKEWWNKFLEQNHLPINKDKWVRPSEAPSWFEPTENSIKYGIGGNFDQGSRYFQDTLTGVCYIYEIQL
ncbi:hypothetical protein [Marinifilum flexuosum]|uniref:hypothetical protein n=1 Tax=Marinifilum flexuosum TaxID=1117708 RepID=UPI0024933DCA|nr:hypothetical protein [Marinifilum flexuosum]